MANNLIILRLLPFSLHRGGLSQHKSLPQQYTRDRCDAGDALLPPRGKSKYIRQDFMACKR